MRIKAFLRKRFWKKQGCKGFSLAEVLLTVGILCILAAVSFPAIGYFNRLLNQMKLDNTAREIFLSAQNKLITMKACGMELPNGTAMGKQPPADYDTDDMGAWPNRGNDTDPFVFVSTDHTFSDAAFTFMDDTLFGKNIQEGEYIIEFNRLSGDVYGVFYWEPQELDFGGKSSFQLLDYRNTFKNAAEGAEESRLRDSRRVRMNSGLKVGYYGGNGAKVVLKEFDFNAEIINAEKLQLKITPDIKTNSLDTQYIISIWSKTDTGKSEEEKKENAYKIILPYDSNSEGINWPNLENPLYSSKNVEELSLERGFLVTLDSVEAGLHFANSFPDIAAGDDINIEVTASAVGYREKRKTFSVNSLFAGLRQDMDKDPTGVAETALIENGRHLQNLSKEASHLGYTTNENEALETKTSFPIVHAKLLHDINWQDGAYNYNENNTLYSAYSASEPLKSFQPICNDDTELRIFDGNGWRISNLNVTKSAAKGDSEEAGLFGVVYDSTKIMNLKMQDCYTESDKAAGTVVGTFAGKSSEAIESSLENIEVIDCTVKGTGTAATGMLVGSVALNNNEGLHLPAPGVTEDIIRHAVLIQNCGVHFSDEHSNEYYQDNSNHAVTNTGGNAGGLVGHLEKGSLVIRDSFSGANVYSKNMNAGGLVGETNDKLFIDNSYSSCDVISEGASGVAAGGLVGKYSGGWIKANNCFTTSDVSASCYSGGAFGYLSGTKFYDSASIRVENVQSYGSVSLDGHVCTDSGNTTLQGSVSGGFVGKIDTGLLSRANSASLPEDGKKNFYMKNCQYLSMKGYNNSNPGTEGSVIDGYGCKYDDNDLAAYAKDRIEISIIPSLYERSDATEVGADVPFMPEPQNIDRKKLTHAYSADLKPYPFPFRLIERMHPLEDSGKDVLEKTYLPYYGNWPGKSNVKAAFVYYEKYGDDDYGYFIRGINDSLYRKDGAIESYLTYEDTLDYNPASAKRVRESGYCLASTTVMAGYDQRNDLPAFENYTFYQLPTTGITEDVTSGIHSMKLPGYDVAVLYHPSFGAAIKFGELTEGKYASDLPAYQVRSGEQLAQIGDSKYAGYTFHQTMNINTGTSTGNPLIASMPANAVLDGKGSHFDSDTKTEIQPTVSYTIDMKLEGKISESKSIGLFGNNDGTLRNINLQGYMNFTYAANTAINMGALVGENKIDGIVDGCISKVNMTLNPAGTSSLGDTSIGGLIGLSRGVCQFSGVENCTILGNGSNLECNSNLKIGGLIGSTNSKVTGCHVFADIGVDNTIKSAKNLKLGGVIGDLSVGNGGGSARADIKASSFVGKIVNMTTDNKTDIGQFAGFAYNGDKITSCYGWMQNSAYRFCGQRPNTGFNGCYYYSTNVSGKDGLTAITNISSEEVLKGLNDSLPAELAVNWQWQMDSVKNVPFLTKKP